MREKFRQKCWDSCLLGVNVIIYLRYTIKGAVVARKRTEEFSRDLAALAEVAKALGHPGRLKILRILAGRVRSCGGIVDRMPLSQSTVSQHLKELKKVGLIRGEVEGPRICYCLDTEAIARARLDFVRLFESIASCSNEKETGEKSG